MRRSTEAPSPRLSMTLRSCSALNRGHSIGDGSLVQAIGANGNSAHHYAGSVVL